MNWSSLTGNPTRYNLVQHNCSTVIYALLAVGSSVKPSFIPGVAIDDHAAGWAQRLLLRLRFMSATIPMWTPDAVLRYADEIAASQR